MIDQNFIKLYEDSFKKNWELPALSDYKDGTSLTYGQLAAEIARIHVLFAEYGLKKGDKVALVGKNHTSWSVVFLGTITYGAVIVPILHDFHPESIAHIIEHSESKIAFINENIWQNMEQNKVNIPVFAIPSFNLIANPTAETVKNKEQTDAAFAKKYPNGFHREDIVYPHTGNEEVICLNYTSGTTGFSKGVMLTANNFAGNVTYAHTLDLLFEGDRDLAFLPMAHAYGCAFDFLYALTEGVHVTLLGVMPTPQNLVKAFQQVKPNIVITVPLILEKIYKKKVLPVIEKPIIKTLLKIPAINTLILNKIRKSLMDALGGNFREVIIGGAALNKEVEAFFMKIKFPITVGYGMTECAPLISYDHHYDFVATSCGSVLKGIMEARIDSPDPENIPGEIQVRGENVMKGYYKNPEATAAAFTNDGWLKTGDSGILDKDNRLYIKGRIKTMILSANGQNIYPEEIESRLNNMPYIAESVVVERNGKLTALIFPDFPAIEADNLNTEEKIAEIMETNRQNLNKRVANYEKISDIELTLTEFEKTPKKSIKRFLYK
ncbi:MAG: AMP-binding protein [Petrimonas sp.]|nr:AMP-binding protein [Petrimonas sp.]